MVKTQFTCASHKYQQIILCVCVCLQQQQPTGTTGKGGEEIQVKLI